MVKAYPRGRFSADITLTPSEVAAFAKAAGDRNPVHHDATLAAGTRYGRLIASGTQTSALLMGLTASHVSASGAMVGLAVLSFGSASVRANTAIELTALRAVAHSQR